MLVVVKDVLLYNSNKKEEFLNQFKEKTREVYTRLFKISIILEEKLNKDLYDFNSEELEDFIKLLKPKTKQSARTYCNVLSSYIQWGLDNKFTKVNDNNPIRRRQEYFYNFVVGKQETMYLTKGDIDAIVDSLVNPQDQFIILGLFNGIQGKELSELTNMKRGDIDEVNNIITVTDNKNGNKREVAVDDFTKTIALLANSDREYYKRNGEVDYSNQFKDVVLLPESSYVLKSTNTNSNNKNGENPISHFTIHNRLEMIKSLDGFEEYAPALTTKNIVRSGMLWEAKKILDEEKEFGRPQIEKVCEKFNMKYKWSLKDFLNADTINSIYN